MYGQPHGMCMEWIAKSKKKRQYISGIAVTHSKPISSLVLFYIFNHRRKLWGQPGHTPPNSRGGGNAPPPLELGGAPSARSTLAYSLINSVHKEQVVAHPPLELGGALSARSTLAYTRINSVHCCIRNKWLPTHLWSWGWGALG